MWSSTVVDVLAFPSDCRKTTAVFLKVQAEFLAKKSLQTPRKVCLLVAMSRPPLRDVATLAGVSEPTVSRVLNGRAGVADATRSRVVDALANLGFTEVPEPGAVRTGMVGVITGELTNPVFGELSQTIATRLARHGLIATLGVAARNLTPEERYVDEFIASGVDGIVMIAGSHARTDVDVSVYEQIVERNVALVLVNGAHLGLDIPYVWTDESLGAARAVDHLRSLGHTNIGAVVGQPMYVGSVRHQAGYERGMSVAGLTPDAGALVSAPFTYEGGVAGGRKMIERGITAVLCANDLMALGVVAAARQAGLEVPRDFSVVGYDGTDFTATSDPALTTLKQPFDDMGELVADALASEIDGTHRFRDTFVFEPDLIVRNSTARR